MWRWVLPCLLPVLAVPGRAAGAAADLTFGGSLALTTDYIYRGLSESGGNGAGQADLHVGSAGGTFGGVWGSTRDRNLDPYARYDIELYLGHRFELSSAWGVTLSARSHYYVGGDQEVSDDYQEIIGSLTYLDRWSFSVTAIPNAVRYWYDERLSRTAAWVAETTGQYLLIGGLFVTGGAGYYHATGTGPGIQAANGYLYGNVGLGFEYRRWRLDVGYFLAQKQARRLSPYPLADDRFAGTLAWRF
jgi:uncharacterized protein (TIGR02001 family)